MENRSTLLFVQSSLTAQSSTDWTRPLTSITFHLQLCIGVLRRSFSSAPSTHQTSSKVYFQTNFQLSMPKLVLEDSILKDLWTVMSISTIGPSMKSEVKFKNRLSQKTITWSSSGKQVLLKYHLWPL